MKNMCWQITIAALMQPPQYDLQCPAAKDNIYICSITHAAAAPSNLEAAVTMQHRDIELQLQNRLSAPKEKKKLKHFWKGILRGKSPAPKWRKSADKSLSQPWCSHSTTICNAQLQKTTVLRMQPRNQATLTQLRRTHTSKVPFIAGCSHFKRKNTRFRAPAFSPSHYNAFWSVTCMSNLHVSTHMATQDDNNHAAIPIRSASTDSRNEWNYAHMNNHTLQNTKGEPIRQWKDRSRNRRTCKVPFMAACMQPFHAKKHKVSWSGFLPNTSLMQHSCSHYNAFCSITWQTCMYLRTWQRKMTTIIQPFQCDLPPQTQETNRTTHTWTTTRCRTPRANRFDNGRIAAATAAHTRYPSSPPAATLREKTQGFVLRLPPQQKPHATFMQPLQYNAFCSITCQTCMYLRTWQHKITTIMLPFQCDRQPQIPRNK